MNKKCMGCGVILQDKDENEVGYTPDINNDYCKRCFRLKNYGELNRVTLVDKESIFKKINKKSGIAFFLIDYLNINKETIDYFKRIKKTKVLVISKSDTLRKEMKKSKIRAWLKNVYNIKEDILFMSNKKNYDGNNLIEYLKKTNYKVAYIMGITNAGKSTFINSLDHKNQVLVSDKENTTLDFIKFKIDDFIIYDTPGFSYTNLNGKIVKKEIKPISYVMKENTGLVIDDKFKFYFKDKNKVTLYLNTQEVKKEYKIKELKYKVEVPINSDIVIPGVGFINVKDAGLIATNLSAAEVRKDVSGDDF